MPIGIGASAGVAIGGILSGMGSIAAAWRAFAVVLVVAVITAACGADPARTMAPRADEAGVPDWRTHPNEPYPFTTPIPAFEATGLDGEYTRPPTDTDVGRRAPCVRCPPYPADKGESVLRFDRGRYELIHQEPPYRTVGHFTYEGETLALFNDPECSTDVGTYRVERDGAQLRFDVIDDSCGFERRAREMTRMTWTPTEIARGESCQPPNTEAAVSGHWPVPSGC